MNAHARFNPVPETLDVEIANRDHSTLITVRGELDLATAPTLQRALDARPDGPLVLDLRGLSFIDASGLAVLIRANAARRHPTRLELIPSGAVIRLLELCRIDQHFTYTDRPPD
jgi:anti-sigma B factor antagonist